MKPPDAQPQPTPDDLRRIQKAAYNRAYYLANRERVLAQVQEYASARRVEIAAKVRAKRAANPEYVRALANARYKANPEPARRISKAWRQKNPEAYNVWKRAWRQENPVKTTVQTWLANQRRRARLRGVAYEKVDPQAIYDRDQGLCALCKKPVERQKLTLDHIVPLAKGGPHTPENLQVAHRSCNARKWTKAMEEFLAV